MSLESMPGDRFRTAAGRPDLYADGFPHGTHEGYAYGCKGSHCPYADELGRSCAEAFVLFQGDYSNRTRVLSGMSLPEILAAEAGDRAAAAEARATARTLTAPAARPRAPKSAKTAKPARAAKKTGPALRRPAASPVAAEHGTVRGYRELDCFREDTCPASPSCAQANLDQISGKVRRQPKAAATPKSPRAPRAPKPARVPKPPKPPREVKIIHGSMWTWQKGCRTIEDCPEHAAGRASCAEVNRAYHRAYVARRRAANDVRGHGSASGYAMGCLDRATCPAALEGGTSCRDAALAEENRRKRAKGVPVRGELTDSAPVLEHIKKLRAAGMQPLAIARAAALSRTFVNTLVYGRSDYVDGGRGPRHGEVPKAVNADKAARILALAPPSTRRS